jgi:hypothetical protein
MTSYYYKTFGLNIITNIPFPELVSQSAPERTDNTIFICLCKEYSFPNLAGKKIISSNCIAYHKQDIGFLFNNKPLFRVINGKKIIINDNVDINIALLRFYVLGPGIGILLYQKGHLVLHGSAAIINGRAVAFLGHSGDGKSTLAAALYLEGHQFITEDILVVGFDEKNKPQIFPGFPQISLWDDAIKNMNFKIKELEQIHPKHNKFFYPLKNNFSINPIPLKRIYILKKSGKNEIHPLKNQNALIELIKQSYNIKLFDNNKKFENLLQCEKLLKNVKIKCLKRDDSSNINKLIKKIYNDISIGSKNF